MDTSIKITLNAILRTDFYSFVLKAFSHLHPSTKLQKSWLLLASCNYALRLLSGDVKRGIVSLPPRSLKSEIFSIFLPAFILGRNPSAKIAIVCYGQELSSDFSMQIREIMQSDWYQEAFPKTQISDSRKNRATDFYTTLNGYVFATSIDGTMTGKGFEYILIDDPLKADQAYSEAHSNKVINWFTNTLPSRVNDQKEGVIALIQQRLHVHDPVGFLLEKGGWNHFCLPAIAQQDIEVPLLDKKTHLFLEGDLLNPEMLGHRELEFLKQQQGSMRFSAQYLQEPIPEFGNLVPVQDLKRYSGTLKKQPGDLIIASWDVAMTTKERSDYSVGTFWLIRNKRYYLLDLYREKVSFSELVLRISDLSDIHEVDLSLIEQNGSGVALVEALDTLPRLNVLGVTSTLSKKDRMLPCTADIEAGRVFVPKEAGWLADFEKECAAFPEGKHDDQVDSLSQFLTYMREKSKSHKAQEKFSEGLQLMAEKQSPSTSSESKSNFAFMTWGKRPNDEI